MSLCPFFKETAWSGDKCMAGGNGDGMPLPSKFKDYCGHTIFHSDYTDCPLYKDATGKNNSGGCYLTTACMVAQGNEFSDDCAELTTLRRFRDSYVKDNYPEDIDTYYRISPPIVKKINADKEKDEIFDKMYNELVLPCCNLIETNKFEEAYNKYKNYSLELYEKYFKIN